MAGFKEMGEQLTHMGSSPRTIASPSPGGRTIASSVPLPRAAPNLLERAQSEYPVLRNTPLNYAENIKGGEGFLEYWPKGEPGSPDRPRPGAFDINKPGVEVFRKDTRPIDVAGDVVSHELIKSDPKIKKYYESFVSSLTPKQEKILREQYEHSRANEGEKRSFDAWKSNTGLPAYFRGYAFKQWPQESIKELYTSEQLKMSDDMIRYLSGRK